MAEQWDLRKVLASSRIPLGIGHENHIEPGLSKARYEVAGGRHDLSGGIEMDEERDLFPQRPIVGDVQCSST